MKILLMVLVILASGKVHSGATNNIIDIYERNLLQQQWSSEEGPCFEAMKLTLNEAKNFKLWAVWMIDSIELPNGLLYGRVSSMGNYDECLSPHKAFDSEGVPSYKYCMSKVELMNNVEDGPFDRRHNVTTDLYLKKRLSSNRTLAEFNWGLCVPSVCDHQAIAKVARALLQAGHLGHVNETTTIEVQYCYLGDEASKPYESGFYIFMSCITILVIITVCCSYYVSHWKSPTDSFYGELARAFCLKRNVNELTKLKDDEIYVMNLMRVFATSSIYFSHVLSIVVAKLLTNTLDVDEFFTNDNLKHLDLMTDMFFTLSSMLLVRGLLTDKWKSPIKYLWKRYVRLVVSLALVNAVMAVVFGNTSISNGPFWNEMDEEIDICKTNWLLNILMIHNLVDAKNMCCLAGWYVGADFQLSVLTVVIFCVFIRSRHLGMILYWIMFSLGIIIPFIFTYYLKYFIGILTGIDGLQNRISRQFLNYLIRPELHLGSFMTGALMGYILFTFKPKNHRKCISQVKSCLILVTALITMMYSMIGGGYYMQPERSFSFEAAVFNGVHRQVWSAAVCLIIVVCEYGDLAILQQTLAWFPLVPLSRLTYPVYLSQYPIILWYSSSQRTTITHSLYSNIIVSIGLITMSFVAGLFVWLFLEAPIVNINNMLLNKTWKNTKEAALSSTDDTLKDNDVNQANEIKDKCE